MLKREVFKCLMWWCKFVLFYVKKKLFICKLNKNDGIDFNVILKFYLFKIKGRL